MDVIKKKGAGSSKKAPEQLNGAPSPPLPPAAPAPPAAPSKEANAPAPPAKETMEASDDSQSDKAASGLGDSGPPPSLDGGGAPASEVAKDAEITPEKLGGVGGAKAEKGAAGVGADGGRGGIPRTAQDKSVAMAQTQTAGAGLLAAPVLAPPSVPRVDDAERLATVVKLFKALNVCSRPGWLGRRRLRSESESASARGTGSARDPLKHLLARPVVILFLSLPDRQHPHDGSGRT